MKRRQFLGLFGAAATAPLMPTPAVAKAASVSAVSVQAAITHAQSRAVFSVWGLAKAANLSIEQATAVMEHLAGKGILGPLQGTTFGGRWASSRILQRHVMAKAQAAKLGLKLTGGQARPFDVDLSRLLAHLRKLSDRHLARPPLAHSA